MEGMMPLGSYKSRVPRDDQVGAVGQRPTKGFKGLSSHQEVMACGEVFESPQVSGQLPDELVVFPNDLVACLCYKKYNFHVCGFGR
jgi:hypothetical protein